MTCCRFSICFYVTKRRSTANVTEDFFIITGSKGEHNKSHCLSNVNNSLFGYHQVILESLTLKYTCKTSGDTWETFEKEVMTDVTIAEIVT